ncbi:hypothetical protein MKW98_015489 [Papaver atlanticum]|uniref:BHLH domain-containing protein n=1 Tax=Papaver atlanticum TaxID=357466 RepID=A0AAD4X6A9_9MAGN|nr:hypothetical protein MKW98_015489 [Papaver atlanticum]
MSDFQAFEASQLHNCDFDQFNDFLDATNIQKLIDQIREEITEPVTNAPNYYHQQQWVDNELMFLDDNNQFFPTPGELYGLSYSAADTTSATPFSDPILANPNFAPSFSALDTDRLLEEDGDGENDGGDYWSGNTITTAPSSSSKRSAPCLDSKRILSSERTRRVRMKHKLYALRALVPNITKMDEASIVGDAVSYVQDLQKQAKKLKTEIAELESSSSSTNKGHNCLNLVVSPKKTPYIKKHQVRKKILKMDVFQVEEGVFCVRLACNKGEGIAVSLYKALDSLTSLDVQSSNFAMSPERLVLTFTVNVRCGENMMDLSNLKSLLNRALLNQGFEYKQNNT